MNGIAGNSLFLCFGKHYQNSRILAWRVCVLIGSFILL